MKIIITEEQERSLISFLINEDKEQEDYKYAARQEQHIKDFLDKNFQIVMNPSVVGEETPCYFVRLDSNGKPHDTITKERLFYIVQSEFPKLSGNENERDKRISDALKDWIKIQKNNKN